ncbi:hypothetical protein BOTBODRAFT_365266 [Botryobasidium botryosum FD-172 SS1]|uniref:Uncharacterized protein n=1 Tax=Botryobasidium botryosum (strain FD-172 SS1) TaxID=930990 RepID=A0A067MG40_BOTB1|nr:hypothetical protein BOTBODRAFT_365266 [Botryobasidium botryosum FD-172 SS1]
MGGGGGGGGDSGLGRIGISGVGWSRMQMAAIAVARRRWCTRWWVRSLGRSKRTRWRRSSGGKVGRGGFGRGWQDGVGRKSARARDQPRPTVPISPFPAQATGYRIKSTFIAFCHPRDGCLFRRWSS